ncbi:hypothetical protein LIER_43422 [Lithospermum erythrorhizon]|uniref:Uncharacterized protein n=1 Tax=Lithospermum erythrorhizon TaxID=34254 RepID=A0AAV3Q3E9_LITER
MISPLFFPMESKDGCYNGRILCNWEIDEASLEDRVQIDLIRGVGSSSGNVNENVEGENDDDEIREENVGGKDVVHREVARVEAGLLAEMRRLSNRHDRLAETQDRISQRLDAQEIRQKKDRKYLKGLLKFMKCFGKREESSIEAQRHFDHSDSDPEVDEHQTVSGTPMRAEDYGFHHLSPGDGDGGMGFCSGAHGGV